MAEEFAVTNDGLGPDESEEVTVGRDDGPYLLLDGEWRGSDDDAVQVALALLRAAGATQVGLASLIATLPEG